MALLSAPRSGILFRRSIVSKRATGLVVALVQAAVAVGASVFHRSSLLGEVQQSVSSSLQAVRQPLAEAASRLLLVSDAQNVVRGFEQGLAAHPGVACL
jgi:hypothetical protein